MAEGRTRTYPGGALTEAGPIAAVHVSRTFAAPREQVFRAWTEAEAVSQWFGSSTSAESDVRVGGGYRITVSVPPTGRKAHVVGTFLEIDRPRRLVYTFAWERMPIMFGMGDSKVTVEFRELEGETEVRLTHELLDKRRLRSFHRWGWNQSLERLARLFEHLGP
jgi:uncharacterized protein YndB with AHSA1/START domain